LCVFVVVSVLGLGCRIGCRRWRLSLGLSMRFLLLAGRGVGSVRGGRLRLRFLLFLVAAAAAEQPTTTQLSFPAAVGPGGYLLKQWQLAEMSTLLLGQEALALASAATMEERHRSEQ
jgi:hypothetical protein